MKKILILLLSALVPMAIHAATPDTMGIVHTALQSATTNAVAKIEVIAFQWLSAFVLIQLIVTMIGVLLSGGEIGDAFKKFLKSLAWFSFCFIVMNSGIDFISKVSGGMFSIAGGIAGTGQFSASYLVDFGLNMAAGLLNAVDKAKGGGILASLDFLPSIFAGITCLMILATAALIGFKIFLIKVEIMLVLMLAPISFSFLGLDALRDQGIAPFKALISLTYRILLLAVIVSAMKDVGDSINAVFATVDPGSVTAVWKPIFGALFGYFLLGYLAYKSDSIASNLASGGTNLGTSDAAVAGAIGAAVGGAVGAAMSTAAGVAGGGATKAASMGDFMKSLVGGDMSVRNASSSGTGGATPGGTAPGSLSLSQGPGGGSSQPGPEAKAAQEAEAVNTSAANNAGQGASDAGASDSVASAAADAAHAGGGSGEIASAVQAAGGSPEQAMAASMSGHTPYPQHVKAATDAMRAGGTPSEVAQAVTAAGGSIGAAYAAHAAAEAIAQPKSNRAGGMRPQGSGDQASINGKNAPGDAAGKSAMSGQTPYPQHVKAATDAMRAGDTPLEAAQAVTAAGGPIGAAAEAIAQPKSDRAGDMRPQGSGDQASINGENAPGDAAGKQKNEQTGQAGKSDASKKLDENLRKLHGHLANESATTHVSINTRSAD